MAPGASIAHHRRLLIITNAAWLVVVVMFASSSSNNSPVNEGAACERTAPTHVRGMTSLGLESRSTESQLKDHLTPTAPPSGESSPEATPLPLPPPSIPRDVRRRRDAAASSPGGAAEGNPGSAHTFARLSLPPVPRSGGDVEPAECPQVHSATWLPLWRESLSSQTIPHSASLPKPRPTLLVSIGENKGASLGHWGALFAPPGAARRVAVDLVKYSALLGIERFCGTCCTCGPLPGYNGTSMPRGNSAAADSPTRFIAFESQRAAYAGLHDFFSRKRNWLPNVDVDIVHRAVLDDIGVTSTTIGDGVGAEHSTIAEAVRKKLSGERGKARVYATTLDYYFATSYSAASAAAAASDAMGDESGGGGGGGAASDRVEGDSVPPPAPHHDGGDGAAAGLALQHVHIDLLVANTEDSDVAILRGAKALLQTGRISTLMVTLPRARSTPPAHRFTIPMKVKMLKRFSSYGFKCFILVQRAAGAPPNAQTQPFFDVDRAFQNPDSDEISADLPFSLDNRLPLLCAHRASNAAFIDKIAALATLKPSSEFDANAKAAWSGAARQAPQLCPVEDYVYTHSMRHTQAPLKAHKELTTRQRRKIRSIAIDDYFAAQGDVERLLRAPLYTSNPLDGASGSGGVAVVTDRKGGDSLPDSSDVRSPNSRPKRLGDAF